MFCSNLFFVFRFIFDFLLKSRKRLKMDEDEEVDAFKEMKKNVAMRR